MMAVYKWLQQGGKVFGDKSQIELGISMVESELKEFSDAVNENEQKDGIIDLLWQVCNLAYFAGLKLDELSEKNIAVLASNRSKFCDTEAEAKATVDAYILGVHPDKMGVSIVTTYKKVGSKYVIYNMDGKIMKSINYKNPDEA